jgi:putative transposase
LRRLDKGFKAFFRRLKAGDKKPGFPRFKGRNHWHSFTIQRCGKVVKNGRIRVSGVDGLIRCRNLRPIVGAIVEQRIVRRAGKWFCQLVIDDGLETPALAPIKSAVGIDVGLTTFATLSNGDTIANPRFGKKLSRTLAHAHRNVSRTVKGSSNRRKAVARLQRVYVKISNARSNFTHRASKKIVSEHQLIAVEDLHVSDMSRGRLAKSILDACWAQFLWQLTYKAEWAGGQVVKVNPSGTSQECSQCGQIVPKDLSVRVHKCDCGCVLDRDLNAAKNVLARAIKLSAPAPGRGDTVMPVEGRVAAPVNQEVLRRDLAVAAN